MTEETFLGSSLPTAAASAFMELLEKAGWAGSWLYRDSLGYLARCTTPYGLVVFRPTGNRPSFYVTSLGAAERSALPLALQAESLCHQTFLDYMRQPGRN